MRTEEPHTYTVAKLEINQPKLQHTLPGHLLAELVFHQISKAHPGAIARKLFEFVFKSVCELPIFTVFIQ